MNGDIIDIHVHFGAPDDPESACYWSGDIDRIIRHLELTFKTERPPPPHHVQKELLMAAEGSAEYL
jgi:hypothetical protein